LSAGLSAGRLAGSVVYLTGGGSGLGRSIVKRFVAEGAHVGVLEISAAKNRGLRDEFAHGVTTFTGDVRDISAHREALHALGRQFGKVDVYIANAAIWDGNTALLDLPEAQLDAAFEEIFAINVRGYLLGAKAAAPALLESGGNMIFTLSTAAVRAGGGGPLYTASKHAGVGLVRQLAFELAPRVRVNAVAPAGMATDLRGPHALELGGRALMADADPERMRAAYPLDFFATPDDYVGPYVLLASRTEGRSLTGIILESDLGLSARGIRAVSGEAQRTLASQRAAVGQRL
jgi:2,3-dihydroxy-2,3-dihydrophenylpropionate dehydrogenase